MKKAIRRWTVGQFATGGDVRRVQKFFRHRHLRTLTVYDDNRQDFAGEVAALVAGVA